eukprot:SAG31_NODE_38366_length_296_cov_2.045685_1_plen_36_part_10
MRMRRRMTSRKLTSKASTDVESADAPQGALLSRTQI